MNTLNPLINEVDLFLKTYVKALKKLQLAHFEQIIKGILVTERKSINSYSKSYEKHQTFLSCFMNSEAVNQSKILSRLNLNNEIDFIFDDTIKHHEYAQHIYGLGTLHDHLKNGYSRDHSLITGGM